MQSVVRLFQRAWGYYRLYGLRRFTWAVARKITAKLSSGSRRSGVSKTLEMPGVTDVPDRSAVAFFRKPRVAILGDLNLPQCKKYRVIQKIEALEHLGVACEYSHYEDVARSRNILQVATLAIFYRTLDTHTFRAHLAECKRLRIPTLYDIDDPIFSAAIYQSNKNLDHLTMLEKANLLSSTSQHRKAMVKCDGAIVSTPRLAEEVRKLQMDPAFLWRNGIDAQTEQAIEFAARNANRPESVKAGDPLRIVYASGSRAHEADFRTAGDSVLELMQKYANVELHVIGYLELPEGFESVENRVFRTIFSDYPSYIGKLAECHICIIPLVPDDFNDCKSAIRYMEAAQVETPSIITTIGDFTNLVTDGEQAMIAGNSAQWREKLEALIASPELRAKIGKAARSATSNALKVSAIADGLPVELKDMIHGR